MKNALALSLLALLFSLIGLGANLLGSGKTSAVEVRSVQPHVPEDRELEARLEALAEENSELRERLVALELRPQEVQREPVRPDYVTRSEFEELLARLDGTAAKGKASKSPVAGKGGATEAELEEFRAHVEETLSEIRKDELASKLRARGTPEERWEESIPKYTDWLGLTPEQTEDLGPVMISHFERQAQQLALWESGEDPEVVGAMKENDRIVHLSEMAEVLNEEQYEAYAGRTGK